MEIRHTAPGDLPRLLEIYEYARRFMARHGNPRQWGATHWPPEALLRRDIAQELMRYGAVEVRLERLDAKGANRMLHFLSGVVFALGGMVQRSGRWQILVILNTDADQDDQEDQNQQDQ